METVGRRASWQRNGCPATKSISVWSEGSRSRWLTLVLGRECKRSVLLNLCVWILSPLLIECPKIGLTNLFFLALILDVYRLHCSCYTVLFGVCYIYLVGSHLGHCMAFFGPWYLRCEHFMNSLHNIAVMPLQPNFSCSTFEYAHRYNIAAFKEANVGWNISLSNDFTASRSPDENQLN